MIPITKAQFAHNPLKPWKLPSREALGRRPALWHTLWDESYSNPRYAELIPRLDQLFFAPIRQREGVLRRVDGALARRSRFERRTLDWYRQAGIRLLLTPNVYQAERFSGPVVVDLDDPVFSVGERIALRTQNLRHVVVTTTDVEAYVREQNSALDVTVVPQGVDLERAEARKHEAVRRRILNPLGLPAHTVIVGYHAPWICLSGERGFESPDFRTFHVDALVAAIRRLWTEDMAFVAVLVGRPSPQLFQFARTESRLILPGYVDRDKLFDWVGTFDIGTYPRTVDFRGRQSVKLLEYMANSAAVVAMETTETRFLATTETGETAHDSDEFCAKLRLLIESRDARTHLAERARPLVRAHNWQVLARRYDRILADVAESA